MTRQLQMTVILSTLVLLLAFGWPISLWSLGECLYFRGPLPNRWGWLTEPQGFGRTPVKNHWFNAWDRSTTACKHSPCPLLHTVRLHYTSSNSNSGTTFFSTISCLFILIHLISLPHQTCKKSYQTVHLLTYSYL